MPLYLSSAGCEFGKNVPLTTCGNTNVHTPDGPPWSSAIITYVLPASIFTVVVVAPKIYSTGDAKPFVYLTGPLNVVYAI